MKRRIQEVDFLRGLAVLGMIIFHLFFILDYYQILQNEMYVGVFLWLLNFVRFSFIGLVGVSLALASQGGAARQIKRGIKILLLGALITLVTFVFASEEFVRFGILHLIGLGVMSFAIIADKKYANLLIAILILFIYPVVESTVFHIDALEYLWYILGFANYKLVAALDYYPVIPWFGLIAFGIFLGHSFFPRRASKLKISLPKPILFLGRNSLTIYLLHIPLIVALVFMIF